MRSRLVAGLLGTLCLGAEAGAAVAGSREVPCDNFGQVGAGLYRGAEPDPRCLEHLAGLGIRTVVNLRDEKDASADERKRALALGLRYFNIPMSGFGRPSAAEVQRVLAMVRVSENQPVFVHCKRGSDRTGVIVATYRIADDGWTAERAVQEAEGFGLAWWQFRMKKFIRDFERVD
jgi:tyrosine-protein phosphatase SIW14